MNETPELDPARDRAIRAMVLGHARSTVRTRPVRRILVVASLATAAVVVAGGIAFGATRHTDAPGPAGVAVQPPSTARPSSSSAPSPTAPPGDLQQAGTPTATPVVDPLAGVTAVRLDAESLVLLDHGSTVETLSMNDTSSAVAALTKLLGAPAVTTGEAPRCLADPTAVSETTYDWGGALKLLDSAAPASASVPDFTVRIFSAGLRSTFSSAVALQATGGAQVGQSIAAAIQSAPATDKQSYPGTDGKTHWTVVLERGGAASGSADGVTGVAAFTDGDVVTTIGSPVVVNTDQDC
jgi:hypothetical protein